LNYLVLVLDIFLLPILGDKLELPSTKGQLTHIYAAVLWLCFCWF